MSKLILPKKSILYNSNQRSWYSNRIKPIYLQALKIHTRMFHFFKYQGAGNDFVLIDNRQKVFKEHSNQALIHLLCDRRFGIGADGLILLEAHPEYDFEMIYFNADGTEGSMCGNGGRCVVAFARFLGIVSEKCHFLAVDGPHEAIINKAGNWVELKMINVDTVNIQPDHYVLDTGSPHFIRFVADLEKLDVYREGKKIRYSAPYHEQGINVNFIEKQENNLLIGTYERGVEDETLACGTGVTAAAISFAIAEPEKAKKQLAKGGITVQAKGGHLQVRFDQTGTRFENIWLCGPAEKVYEGKWD